MKSKRIQAKLTLEEFKNVCKNLNENMCMKDILTRYNNYLMFKKTSSDDRTDSEVGAKLTFHYVKDENGRNVEKEVK